MSSTRIFLRVFKSSSINININRVHGWGSVGQLLLILILRYTVRVAYFVPFCLTWVSGS